MRIVKKQSGGVTSQSSARGELGGLNQEESGKVDRKVNSFSNLLEIKKVEARKEKFFSLISSLDQLGEQLRKQPTISMYTRYRNHVRNILELAVPKAFGLEKTFSRPSVQNPQSREFHLLNVVDSEMESLLKLIKEKEKDRLLLASKVVKIKGLIIDLLR